MSFRATPPLRGAKGGVPIDETRNSFSKRFKNHFDIKFINIFPATN